MVIILPFCFVLAEMGVKSRDRPQGGVYDDLKNELHLGDEDWEVCTASQSASAPPSYTSSAGSHDEWSKTIEDLDSITHFAAMMMCKLQQNLSLETPPGSNKDEKKSNPSSKCDLREESLRISEQGVDDTGNPFGSVKLRPRKERRQPSNPADIPDMAILQGPQFLSAEIVNEAELHLQEVEEQLQNIFTPTPIELFRVTLYKYHDKDNFGFSLSDGVYEKGVYISAIRPGGPADKCGNMLPFDRVLQINNVRLQDQDCSEAIPLIARSGNEVSIVISRNPLAGQGEEGSDIWELQSDAGSYRSQTV